MLTAKPAKLIAEKAVPHSLLFVLHMLAEHACSQSLLLMLRVLTTKPAKLIVEKVVPHSLLLVFQMGQNSSKGIGA